MHSIKVIDVFLSINGSQHQILHEGVIDEVTIDSRKIYRPKSALFFALKGAIMDGHEYLQEAINRGVKSFVISDSKYIKTVEKFNYILVQNCVEALQEFARYYKALFDITTVAITGSNGKTTVKEWLSHLLSKHYKVAKSPGSFNSQIGVPLSIFQIEKHHEVGVFEAGISKPNEMRNLEMIIQPSLGIFTNIGEAHSGGFSSKEEKIIEKLNLFTNTKDLIVCIDHIEIINAISQSKIKSKIHTWGSAASSTLFTVLNSTKGPVSILKILYKKEIYEIEMNVSDDGSIENFCHTIAALLVMNFSIEEVIKLSKEIFPIPLRLEMSKGQNDCTIINDAYNHDLTSLVNALEFLQKQKGNQKSIAILSDIEESIMSEEVLSKTIQSALSKYSIDEIWWVGRQGVSFANRVFDDLMAVENYLATVSIAETCILIKGARKFHLDHLKRAFISQRHSSTLTIDLGALDHNLQMYSKFLKEDCGIIAVVKAGAYGSGSVEMARLLEYRNVSYLAVAFTDEGIALRKAGISIPTIVLNPDEDSFYHLDRYKLEPEIYSLGILKSLLRYCEHFKCEIPIHLKLDTGMNRLGLKLSDLDECLYLIKENKVKVATVFSHMSGSENVEEDTYSIKQHEVYMEMVTKIIKDLGYKPKMHFVNTGGIVRFPEFHHDLVRLGLGLYGIDTTHEIGASLEKVHTFTARIIQVKWVEKGEKIGYNQKGTALRKTKLAIVNVGYADGLPRGSGLGKYALRVNNEDAPIIGNVCMDLTIIDVTDILNSQEGDIVELFGPNKPIELLAEINNTIPYEILARISQRVRKEWILG